MFDRSILYFIINLENKKKASLLDLMNKLGQKIVRIIIIKNTAKMLQVKKIFHLI